MASGQKADFYLFNDQPISAKKHDKLGRKRFAEQLAYRIKKCGGKDSCVLAITGGWGSGKTSVKNMLVQSLSDTGKSPVTVLEFNPWQFSGHTSLTEAFFEELAKTFRRQTSEDSKKLAARLGFYSRMITLGRGAFNFLKYACSASSPSDNLIPDFGIDIAIDGAKNILKVGQDAALAEAAMRESMPDFKKSLSNDIGRQPKPLVVIIDDIDRLTTQEIRELFQLVKSNADFPNTVYVLLFDRHVVAEALDETTGRRGHLFLEKITQAIYPVPQPRLEVIHKLLCDGIDKILLTSTKQKSLWEQQRWEEAWPSGLRPYFENLRNVYRFLNSLEFHASQLVDGDVMEFNSVDLLALEVLRLFEPALYEIVPKYRASLVGDSMESMMAILAPDAEKSSARQARVAHILTSANRKDPAKVLIKILFPRFFNEEVSDLTMHKGLRVGNSQFFDRYFSLSLSDFEVPKKKLDQLLTSVEKPVTFKKLILSMNRAEVIPQTFERLDAYHSDIPKKAFPAAIQSLTDIGDFLPSEEWATARYTDPLLICWRMIYFSLSNIKPNDRLALLRDGFSASDGVRLVVYTAAREERRESNTDKEFLVSEAAANELIKIALVKIEKAVDQKRLKDLPSLQFTLWRWSQWGDFQTVKNWVAEQVTDASGALWFLRTIRNSMTVGEYILRYVDLDHVERFIAVDSLHELTKSIELSNLKGEDYYALNGFRTALRWKEEGRPSSYRCEYELEGNPIASRR